MTKTQESYLFHDSILANIRYGRPAASLAEVQEAARAAYIHGWTSPWSNWLR